MPEIDKLRAVVVVEEDDSGCRGCVCGMVGGRTAFDLVLFQGLGLNGLVVVVTAVTLTRWFGTTKAVVQGDGTNNTTTMMVMLMVAIQVGTEKADLEIRREGVRFLVGGGRQYGLTLVSLLLLVLIVAAAAGDKDASLW